MQQELHIEGMDPTGRGLQRREAVWLPLYFTSDGTVGIRPPRGSNFGYGLRIGLSIRT